MADKIHSFYLKAEEIGGIKARAKLSILTAIDSYQARTIPDTEDNIRIFEKAMKQLMKEFSSGSAEKSNRFKAVKSLFSRLAS